MKTVATGIRTEHTESFWFPEPGVFISLMKYGSTDRDSVLIAIPPFNSAVSRSNCCDLSNLKVFSGSTGPIGSFEY